jgi:ComF family protein
MASEAALSHSPGHCCGDCRKSPPAFSLAVSPYAHEGALAKAIHVFKYQQQPRLATPLVHLFINDLSSLQIDMVMAIPLHLRRLREREFNQSLLLAQEVSRLLSIPLCIDAMQRIRETSPQVGLSRKARQKNIHRAFQVRRPESIQDQRILLVDDVFTTGATLREGAKTLIQSGAKNVVVAALARMVPQNA